MTYIRKEKNMTQREFLNAVVKANISEEVTASANKYLAAIDKRNATPTKAELAKRAENEALKTDIAKVLADGNMRVASEIGAVIGATTSKVSALLRQMVDAGIVNSIEVKQKGKGKVKGYVIVNDDANDDPQIAAYEMASMN